MKKKTNFLVSAIITIAILISVVAINFSPLLKGLNLGLDLKGGFEVLYEVEPIVEGDEVTEEMIASTIDIITRRIDEFGLSEPVITREGDYIRIQLAGVEDQSSARDLLSKTATLTFRDTSDNLLMTSDVLYAGRAKRDVQDGRHVVTIGIKDNDLFYEVTGKVSRMSDNRMVIWLDHEPGMTYAESENCTVEGSRCISAPSVPNAMSGSVYIQGAFTEEEADNLAKLINAGSLPTKLKEIYSTNVGAALGVQALEKTGLAGLIGIVLVFIFMTAFYRFSGLIASISLIAYSFVVFLLFWLMGGTLTLPGIAAMVLGVGMAVDANVITFERIKEELLDGRSLQASYLAGNKKSFLTIVDANITTLLVAITLFVFGQSSVKGFATMLMISIFATFVITIFLTRFILSLIIKSKYFDQKLKLFINVDSDDVRNIHKNEAKKAHKFAKLDFVSKRKRFFSISAIIIIVGLLTAFVIKPNLGVDFVAGSKLSVEIAESDVQSYVDDLETLGFDVKDQSYVQSEGLALIRISEVLEKEGVLTVTDLAIDDYKGSISINTVSPIVGRMIVENAVYSMLIASLGIVIYITLRFRSSYAIAAIIALLHDALFVLAIFFVFRLEISAIFVAAILSILGYSINDTIVAFDRIRENIKLTEKEKLTNDELVDVVNTSLQQTLVRSINTTVTAILPVLALVLFGSNSIFNFNLALLIGLIVGTYSSIFIAAQVWLVIEKRSEGKTRKSSWFDLSDEDQEQTFEGINK